MHKLGFYINQTHSMRKILKISFYSILGLLLIMLILPIFFKPQIVNALKNEANTLINGKFEFEDANLSLLKDFPNLSISILKPQCYVYSETDTSQFFNGEEIRVSLNFWKILMDRQNMVIKSFGLIQPTINYIQYDSLRNNGQILKLNSDSSTANTNASLEISSYFIENGSFILEDRFNHVTLQLLNLNHNGKILQSNESFDLNSNTTIQSFNYSSNGIPLFANLLMDLKLNLNYSEYDSKLKIREAALNFNNLKLQCNGDIQLLKDSTVLNLALQAPGNQFKDLFSILPNAYTKDYKSVESDGTFMLAAKFNGIYSSLNKLYPNWDIQCKIDNGTLKYPQKQLKIQDVYFDIKSANSDIYGNGAYFTMNDFKMNLNNQVLSGSIEILDIFKEKNISGKLKGILNLADLNSFYPMANGTTISGKVLPNIDFKFNEHAIANNAYSEIKLEGSVFCDNIIYMAPQVPKINITQATVNLNPELIQVSNFNMLFGKSDIKSKIDWIQPLKYFTASSNLNIKIESQSQIIDLTEWLSEETSTKSEPSTITTNDLKGVQISIKSSISKLIYPDYKINNLACSGLLLSDQFQLSDFSAEINGNQIQANGTFNNLASYMLENKVLKGKMQLNAAVFDADLFLKIDTNIQTTQGADTLAFQIPPEFNLDINFKVKQFIYRPLKMNELQGQMKVAESEVLFDNINSNAMGGKMILNGLFSTKNPTSPSYNFKYDLSKVRFSNAFNSLVSVKKLAPIMGYIQGFFNSNIILQGSLDKALNPIYESINLDGFIETLEGSIKGFKPIDQMASKLNLSSIKNINLKNTKNWITVKNGFVSIKEFNKSIEDVGITIGGNHKINGEMDYKFLFNIPKNKFEQVSKTVQLEKGLEKLNGVLSKTGINGLNFKTLNILVSMKGSLTNPELNLKWVNDKGDEQSASTVGSDLKNSIKDSLTNRAEQESEKLKERAANELNKYEDSLLKKANEKTDNFKKDILEKGSKEATKVIDSNLVKKAKDILNQPLDSLKKPGDKVNVDDIKNKMKEWNPFKKEKK